MKGILVGLGMAVLFALPAAGVDMHCVDRDGRCMAVSVNGQKAVKLGKATKKKLEGMRNGHYEREYYLHETHYEVAAPIQGDLDIQADRSADSKGWFGEGRSFEVIVVPLAEVDLKTHQQLGSADSVRAEGAAIATVENVLEGKRLPPGPYLLIVRLQGESNWDRMTLFVQVAG